VSGLFVGLKIVKQCIHSRLLLAVMFIV